MIKFHQPRLTEYKKANNMTHVLKELFNLSKFLKDFSYPVWRLLNDLGENDKFILFEGAQGALLDIDFGTYPFVTSSNTSSGQIFSGSGFGIKHNHRVFGITKAYTTRVGSGPFPTELNDNIAEHLGEKGQEYGTVTRRKRRCGWFDANLVKQSVKISGITDIVLTKLDILDELDFIQVCVGYILNDKKYDYLPFNELDQSKIKPIYEKIPGWKESTFGITKWSDLPINAKKYVLFLEELIDIKISIISTGPERSQTIDKENILGNI